MSFIPPVDNPFDLMFFAAPHKRDGLLSLPVFVTGQNVDALEFRVYRVKDPVAFFERLPISAVTV